MSRRIAIVGNGELPVGIAEAIDSADLVIRFNMCHSFGPGGGKTDIVAVCNTGRPGRAMLAGDGWKSLEAVRAAKVIYCVRDPAYFAALRPKLCVTHPDLDDFCDDYTPGFVRFSAESGRDLRIVPAGVHERLDAALAAFQPPPYVVPSSGAIVIADVLENLATPGDDVAIAGFGHEGWLWHPFASERQWIDSLIAEGRLRRLDPIPR